ncbi:MAG: GNAT family N-acetyltransferase [Anaerolineales bacterium]|nr:GNAT family N-acetyltransferase [Anaerolineales bacterium]
MNQRNYQDERDWHAMLNLLVEGRAANNGAYYVHTGDVSWWLHYHDADASFAEQIALWEDGERLLGWVLFTPDENFFDLFVHPSLCGTAEAAAMHEWSERQLAALGGKTVRLQFIAASDSVRRTFLESRGYQLADESEHLHRMYVTRRTLNSPISNSPLPDGFTMRGCLGEAELEARATAQYGAFQSKWEWGKYTARWRRFMRSPVYVPERDVVAVAPDGRIAAFAIHWVDAVNGVGYFEPVGTHPDFQRLGLGRAVLAESMRRMQAAGLPFASVCCDATDPRAVTFYQACGFEIVETLLMYQKHFGIE